MRQKTAQQQGVSSASPQTPIGFQQVGIASNPANGINNIPLTGGDAGMGAAGQGDSSNLDNGSDGGLQPDEMLKVLRQIQNAPAAKAIQYQQDVEGLLNRSQNPQIQEKLQKLLNALVMTGNPRQNTVDPATGKEDPTSADLAGELSQEITQMTKPNPQKQQGLQNQQGKTTTTASPIRINVRISTAAASQAAGKKKTRGNPFRVLMGKVGKLLDHGLEKSTIVREIKKRINFDEDTIARAVDIVKDYNKDKRRNDRAEDKNDKSEKKSSAVFNAARWAATKRDGNTEANDIYSVKPEYAKRSTAELIARKTWLEDLRDMGKKAADSTGVATELKAIRSALTDRGFDESEI